MQVQINYGDVENSQTLTRFTRRTVDHTMRHLADVVTRVEVHLRDDKQGRVGDADKRVTMEARIAGQKPMAVDHRAKDLYTAVAEAAGKLMRAVSRRLERSRRG